MRKRQLKKKLAGLNPVQRRVFISKQRILGVPAIKLHRAGATLRELRADYTTAVELKKVHLNRTQLKRIVRMARELRAHGTRWRDMVGSGGEVLRLWRHGVSIKKLKSAGYTAEELLRAEATVPELKKAGYSEKEIKKATE